MSEPASSSVDPIIRSALDPHPASSPTPEPLVAPVESAAAPMPYVAPQASVPSTSPTPTVSPVAPAAPTVPKYEAAMPPLPSNKGPMIAAIAIGIVVLTGVAAGLVLSQQNADNRQQAYVAPETTTQGAAAGAVAPSGATIVVLPSAKNGFIALQKQYPGAQQIPLTGDVRGTLYVADSASGSKQIFIQLNGVENSPDKRYVVWISADMPTFVTTLEVDADGKAYGSGLLPEGVTTGSIDVSYENISADATYTTPTQKVSHAQF